MEGVKNSTTFFDLSIRPEPTAPIVKQSIYLVSIALFIFLLGLLRIEILKCQVRSMKQIFTRTWIGGTKKKPKTNAESLLISSLKEDKQSKVSFEHDTMNSKQQVEQI